MLLRVVLKQLRRGGSRYLCMWFILRPVIYRCVVRVRGLWRLTAAALGRGSRSRVCRGSSSTERPALRPGGGRILGSGWSEASGSWVTTVRGRRGLSSPGLSKSLAGGESVIGLEGSAGLARGKAFTLEDENREDSPSAADLAPVVRTPD